MEDSFRLTQISTIVFLIDKVKYLSNSIQYFKEGTAENLDIPMDFAKYVDHYGERQAQILLDKAIGKFLGESEQIIEMKVGDYLLKQPKEDIFLTEIITLNDLAKSLDKYLQAFPKQLKKLVEYYESKVLGRMKPYAELPLNQAEYFVKLFHQVLNQPQDLPYVLTPLHLNGTLQIGFLEIEDAEEYARKLSPSEIWRKGEDGSKLEKVGSY